MAIRTELRFDPDYDGPVVVAIDPGTEVELLIPHESREWYWVRAHHAEGWVNVEAFEQGQDVIAHSLPYVSNPEDIHHLGRLKKYPFIEGTLFGGTTTLRMRNGTWVQGFRSYSAGAGFGWCFDKIRDDGFFFAELHGGLHRDQASLANSSWWAFSAGARLRYLRPAGGELGWGALVGGDWHYSRWPYATLPTTSSASGFQFPVGMAISYAWSRHWTGIFDTSLVIGKYPGFQLSLNALYDL